MQSSLFAGCQNTVDKKCAFFILKVILFIVVGVSITLLYLISNFAFLSANRGLTLKDYLTEKIDKHLREKAVLDEYSNRTGVPTDMAKSFLKDSNRTGVPTDVAKSFLKDSHLDIGGKADLPFDPSCFENFHKISFEKFNDSSKILETRKDVKKILIWHSAFGSKTMDWGNGMTSFEKACCKESRCFITGQRNLIPLQNFDAIVVQSRELTDLPKLRHSFQRWVFYELESASYVYYDLGKLNGLFNWTMTYRRDSDIFTGYGLVLPKGLNPLSKKDDLFSFHNTNFTRGKSKLVTWFVSNCNSLSYREHYVEQLKAFIPIDIFGNCGDESCPRSTSSLCYQRAAEKYKFYLSFENSLCKDYVTEKFFNILRYNIVPVVYGFGNYEAIAPPHSYINALSFPSAKSLADYLLYLDRNETAYNEYFRWKDDYEVHNGGTAKVYSFCKLCQKLHEDKSTKVYENIKDWFVGQSHCRRLLPISWLEWAVRQVY